MRDIQLIFDELKNYKSQEWEVTKGLIVELFDGRKSDEWNTNPRLKSEVSELLLEIKWHEPYTQVIQLGKMTRKDLSPGVYADWIMWRGYSALVEALEELDRGFKITSNE